MTEQNDDNTQIHVVLTKDTKVHHYRIIEKIGAGGMGEVYLAEDTKLKRQVALKFLPPHLMTNKDVRLRFTREAQTVAKLNHPHIVSIYDVNDFNGRPFYVMELVEGKSLHDFCHKDNLTIDQIIEYAIQICQGLGEAHRAGIIHRDIKSANIAVDKKERIKILDFGLAASGEDDKITKTGSTLGTVAYMAPEQVSGRELDNRADLFSLGVVLYELIAGRTPFKRDNEGATLNAIMTEMPEPLSRYRADVPEKLQQVVSELLEKDKELRFQTAEGVIAALKRIIYDSHQSSFKRESVSTTEKKSNKSVLIGILVVLVVVVAAVGYYYNQSTQSVVTESVEKVPMIVVLPFENLGSAEDQYFAEGMTEEITSRLAMIDGLGVISRTSAMQYRETDKSLKEIGSELNVDYVLEGTVRWSKVGDNYKIRITPQLIRVSDDRHMWAGNFEKDLIEVFAVQAEIAEQIVAQLGMTLVEKDKETLAQKPTENAEAYQLYLKVLNSYRNGNFWEEKGFEKIDTVINLDPNFALAYALRAELYSTRAFGSPTSDDGKIAYESAKKSLELQPGLASGHIALGMYYNMVETDYDKALEQFSLAKSEVHNNADLLSAIAYVQMRQGKFELAQENKRKATELDPLNPKSYMELAQALVFTKKYNEAEQAINSAISLKKDQEWFYHSKILLYISKYGDEEKIKPVLQEALANCDSLEVFKSAIKFNLYLPEYNWDSIKTVLIQSFENERDSLQNDTLYFSSLTFLFKETQDIENLQIYGDSMMILFEEKFDQFSENPYAVSGQGEYFSLIGECDKAVEYGEKAKELLSVDECHW